MATKSSVMPTAPQGCSAQNGFQIKPTSTKDQIIKTHKKIINIVYKCTPVQYKSFSPLMLALVIS